MAHVTFEDIETLVDRLYEIDSAVCHDLGFASGFYVPDTKEDRQDIVDDLHEAIANSLKEVYENICKQVDNNKLER